MHAYKKYFTVLSIIAVVVAVNILFYFVSPQGIVSYLGAENTYLIAFTVAAIGGLSTLTGTALYATIVTFASGGSDPNFLGLAAGIGIFISDSIFFFLAYHGRKSVPLGLERRIMRLEVWTKRISKRKLQLFIYFYLSLAPLPNDVLMIALALGGLRYRDIAPAILLGSLTIAFLAAHLGQFIFG
jgi:hypothetical protein